MDISKDDTLDVQVKLPVIRCIGKELNNGSYKFYAVVHGEYYDAFCVM